MEQQEGKNILEMEQFLNSLEKIVNKFEQSVSSINNKLSSFDKKMNDILKAIEKSNNNLVLEKDELTKTINNGFDSLQDSESKNAEKVLKELKNEIEALKSVIEDLKKTESEPVQIEIEEDENK